MKRIARKPKFHRVKARTNLKTRKPRVVKDVRKSSLKFGEKEE